MDVSRYQIYREKPGQGGVFSHATRVYAGKVLRVVVTYLVLVTYLAGWFGKAELNGWHDYLRFYTNWSWSTESVFYLGLAIGTLYQPLWDAVVRVLFLPVLSLAWFVWVMLQIIVATDPGLLDTLKDMPMRVFEIGNDFYHALPVVLIMTVAAVEGDNIKHSLHRAWFKSNAPAWLHILYMLWCVYFPIWLGLAYCITENPMEVYGVTAISVWWVLVIGIGVATGIGGIAFVYYMPYVSNKPV